MIVFVAEAYALRRVRDLLVNAFLNVFLGRADMPAYIHHHDDIEPAFVICPSCVGLPMFVRDVEPHWSMAKIDFTYECAGLRRRSSPNRREAGSAALGGEFVGWAKRSVPTSVPTL